MLIVAGLAIAALLAGWVIGRHRALALMIIVPLIAVAPSKHTVQQIADEFGVTHPTIYRHVQRPSH